ncbi:uncharacterized protein LOC130140445 [Syzygium oleosum]|uniref:uncharacterized protein LOC130140445 n=1 Tax=Syzygium oleosum TaxID=219896 RepID=UPI0024B88B81|nr:uncharacterized protein LOC130140445 [Syzygium oleosum]
MSVDQYEAEFSRLSKFAPRMVEDPWDKARRFRDGLKPDLHGQMVSLNLRDYNEIYERAQAIERDFADRAAASGSRYAPVRDNRNFGKRPISGNQRFVPPARKNIGKPNRFQNRPCRLCGQRHGNGSCPNRGKACFGCGGIVHHIRNCPNIRQTGSPVQLQPPRQGNRIGAAPSTNQNRPAAQGRVYAMARREVEDAPGVVTEPKPLDVVSFVATPLNDKMLVSLGCSDCKIVIGDVEERIDLAVLPMFDFDVIVGMD